jgi:hypothetical protein
MSMTPKALRDAVAELREFVASDGVACTYQSLGQYRSAVLRQIDTLLALLPGEGCDDRHPMRGRMATADFSEDTVTFRMIGDYYAAAGEYVITAVPHTPPPTDAPDGERR